MSEATPAVAEVHDPFNGQSPSFEEFSKFRETGEVPERFKPAAPEPKPAATEQEAKPAEDKGTSEAEQEQKQEREQDGKFKAKDKEPLFSADQQKAFDRAFAKREAKLRREFEEQIAALKTSSTTQATAPAKEPTKEAATTEPQPPEIPDITTFPGSAEEFQKALKEYPAKLAAYLKAQSEHEASVKSLQKRLADSEAAARKEHADFQDQFDGLVADVESGEEPKLPQEVLKAIAEETDDPHGITYHLAANRDEYRRLAELTPNQALKEVLKLEFKLQREKEAAKAKPAQEPKPRQTSAPAPPEPVGARATAKAFDVNDESLSADEWAKKRNELVFGKRR